MSFICFCRGDLEKQRIYKNSDQVKKLCGFVELIRCEAVYPVAKAVA